MMFPLCFNLKNTKILFIGGGKVAERKIRSIIKSGAVITVIAPQESLTFEHENIRLINKGFDESDITNEYGLVFACTDNRDVNAKAASRARELKIPVNVADDPDNCDFHMPSIISTDQFTISVSTGGRSPSEAKTLRIKLEELIKNNL